jgi:isopentenyl diphosphate isomerase/L-lactate dehydrogenase-like FMN-dependent dehydrogenase
MWRDRDLIASITERARLAGYRALCVTIDVPVHGNRERDRRNGMTIPPRITARNFWDAAWRLRWLRDQLIGERFTFANLTGVAPGGSAVDIGTYQERELYKPGSDWSDIAWLREIWNGPLLIKGIMSADDAKRALDHGVNGLIISNHGGRQLDGLPGTIDVLPRISAAVRGQLAILLDGGIRRGSDVVKAIALGAAASMIGRPYLWGLAADGEAGVTRVLEIFRQEIDRTMALMGCPRVSDLDPSVLERFPA